MDWLQIIVGTAIGAPIAALVAVAVGWYAEWATAPNLHLVPATTRAQGQDGTPHEFYHVAVRHKAARPPFSSRRPAWACSATLEILDSDGHHRIVADLIHARWPSQPQPVETIARAGTLETELHFNQIYAGRRTDIHYHESRQADGVLLDLAVKYAGEEYVFVFSNESYFHSLRNPAWRLPVGNFRIKCTVYYEAGQTQRIFLLANVGTTLDDVILSADS